MKNQDLEKEFNVKSFNFSNRKMNQVVIQQSKFGIWQNEINKQIRCV